jgi:Sel1 repeat
MIRLYSSKSKCHPLGHVATEQLTKPQVAMRYTKYLRACLLPAISIAACMGCLAQAENYDETIKQARGLMKEDKLPEATAKANEAIKLDPKRYEAFAVTALIAVKQGDTMVGKDAVAKALLLAPSKKRASLEALQKKLAETGSESPAESASAPAQSPEPAPVTAQLTGEARRQLDVLTLIVEEADKAPTATERRKLLKEFLDKSEPFLRQNPNQFSVWLLRAASAVELDRPALAWQAGRQLKALGADASDAPTTRKVMAMLDRKGWLGNKPPDDVGSPEPGKPWVNSLGTKFLPLPDSELLLAVEDMTPKDFVRFKNETGDQSAAVPAGMPAFQPVAAHWEDCVAYCDWLTKTERAARRIPPDAHYRLPSAAEMRMAFELSAVGGESSLGWSGMADHFHTNGGYWRGTYGIMGKGTFTGEAELSTNENDYVESWTAGMPVKYQDAHQGIYAYTVYISRSSDGTLGFHEGGPKMGYFERWFRCVLALGTGKRTYAPSVGELAKAQYNWGVMCENGQGAAKNEAEAVRWYRKAADHGNVDAQAALKRLQGVSQ